MNNLFFFLKIKKEEKGIFSPCYSGYEQHLPEFSNYVTWDEFCVTYFPYLLNEDGNSPYLIGLF